MSTSNHGRAGEQRPSPSAAPQLAAPIVGDGVSAHKASVDPPPRESNPSTVASHHASEPEINDHRPFIEPHGDGVVGATSIVSMITDIFQCHYGGAYVRFLKIPIHIRNLWFEEFGKRFRWLPQHDALVRVNWEKRCKRRLSDTLHKIRKTKSCPPWIAPEYWTSMLQKFNSPSFQKISSSVKRNRAQAGPSHTGGSISFSEHEEHERRSKGADFTYKELYKRLHMFQDGPRKGDFVTKRSRKVLADVEEIEQRYSQMDSTSSVDSSSLLKEKEIFKEAAGGMKKGRVFGLGSEGHAISQCHSIISLTSTTPQSLEEIRKELQQEFQENAEKLKQEYEQKSEKLQQELRVKDQKWRSNIKNIKE